MEQAYIRGFIKEAKASGLTQYQAIELFKLAEEKKKKEHKKEEFDVNKYIERYLAMKALNSQVKQEHPVKASLSDIITSPLGVFQPAATASVLNKMHPEMYDTAAESLKQNSYSQQALRGAISGAQYGAIPGAFLGSLVGGSYGAGVGVPLGGMLGGGLSNSFAGIPSGMATGLLGGTALGGLGGALLGGASGALLGGGYGSLKGLLSKLINSNISEESKTQAGITKKKHPTLTNLPYGELISAGYTGK